MERSHHTVLVSDRACALHSESKGFSEQVFFYLIVRTKQNLVGYFKFAHLYFLVAYYRFAFIYEKHIVLPLYEGYTPLI